jgi:hypothetical protein
MRLILHTLSKDFRRQWPEIVGFCVATALWAWREVYPLGFEWLRQRELSPIVMFGLWILITIRAVQCESLVGDREWWPTRPYRWGQLLAAKALLLVIAVHGPLVGAQLFLLHHAQIPFELSLIPRLILLQGMFLLFVTFPTAVLASVTASLVQWVMAVVGLLVALLVSSWLPWGALPTMLSGQESVARWATALMLVPVMIWALVWQYARRREWPARIALAGALAAIPIFVLVASTTPVRQMAYPQAGVSSMKLTVKSAENGIREFDWSEEWRGGYEIKIPIVAQTMANDEAIRIQGYRLVLGGSGWRWNSDWRNSAHDLVFFDPDFEVDEFLPEPIDAQVKQGHVTSQIEVAYETYRLNPPMRVQVSADGFTVPGIGYCRSQRHIEPTAFMFSNWSACAALFSLPPVYLLTIDADGNKCIQRNGEPEVPAGHTAYELQFASSVPADFNPNPVRGLLLQGGSWVPPLPQRPGEFEGYSASVCPGSSFVERTGRLTGRQRATFDLGDIGVSKTHTANEASEEKAEPFSRLTNR